LSSAKYILLAIAIVVSFFHWIGIALTGALIGFISNSYRMALLLSFLFVLALWLMFLGYSAVFGLAEKMIAFPLTYVSLALSSAISIVASMLRAFR